MLLHWLVAGMLVVQFVLAKLADLAEEADSAVRELALLANHKSVGITILILVIVRLVWRLRKPPPALPATMPKWQVTASHVSHWSLYVLLLAMPVSGWLMSSASAYSVSWFNLFQLPDFVAPDPELKDVFEAAHEVIGKLLIVVAGIHVLAAIKHFAIDKDGVLARMISSVSLVAFVVVVVLGTGWLGSVGRSSSPASTAVPSATQADRGDTVDAAITASDLPVWQVDHAASYIRFVGDQAGAEFEGVWESWNAAIQFSAHKLGASAFDVTVDTTSAETQDDDRDSTLADPEWFDTINFPEAFFRTRSFSLAEDGTYIADGDLTIKNVSTPVQLLFAVSENSDSRVLIGTAQLDRLALGVGTGEWEDTNIKRNSYRFRFEIEPEPTMLTLVSREYRA